MSKGNITYLKPKKTTGARQTPAHVLTKTLYNIVHIGTFQSFLQVNLFQKPSFLHQLTHNMTRDCSLNSPEKYKFRTCCVQILFWMSKQKQKNSFCTKHVIKLNFSGEFNEQSLVILWLNWCKNEGFWKRFTCIGPVFVSPFFFFQCELFYMFLSCQMQFKISLT